MDVMIIPEDPTLDQHILKPVVERIFNDIGRSANVEVLQDPRMQGIDMALDPEIVQNEVIDIYRWMVDLFVVIVDRDCNQVSNEQRAATLRKRINDPLLVCLAREEVEAWMLYLHRAQLHQHLNAGFGDVRDSCSPKEEYAEPLLDTLNWTMTVGKGRKKAMRNLGEHWQGLTSVCDELDALREQIRDHLSTTG